MLKAVCVTFSLDGGDVAIRVAAKWYSSHLLGTIPTVLLTNDAECLKKARADSIQCHTGTESPSSVRAVVVADPLFFSSCVREGSFVQVPRTC